jgi:protein maelstrom
MSDNVVVTYSSPSAASIHSVSPNIPSSIDLNEYEIKTEIHSDLPFYSKKKLIQFKPTHHDIFHSSNLNGPTFKQIILVFLMFVLVTSLCSYLYKDSLVNVLLILETLPWWTTFLFFCVLFTIVSLPFAWGYILLNIACGFLYGLVYGVIFIIIYASIGLSVSFYLCRFILTHNYCVIKNLKTTFENSEIIQTLIKVLNCPDGYKIIFLSRLTPIPLGLQNGFYSISNISFRIYLFWSLCGLIPTQFIYCLLGSRLHSMTDLILIDKRTKTVGIVVGLCECFMTVVLTYYVFHTAKKVLNKLILETSASSENLMTAK